MVIWLGSINYLHLALAILLWQTIAADGDKFDDLYDVLFRFHYRKLSLGDTIAIIDHLHDLANRFRFHPNQQPVDPRKYNEISFWKKAAELDLSKCNHIEFRTIRSRWQKARSAADKAKQASGSERDRFLNLDTYYQYVLKNMMSYCSGQIPALFYHLQESTKNNFDDLVRLTQNIWHISRRSRYKIGENVGKFLASKLTQADIMQLRRSLENIDLVKLIYDRYTPCYGLLEAVEEHRGFYELVAKARYYPLKSLTFPSPRTESGYDNMKNWVDRVESCKFIQGSQQVFEIALEYLVLREPLIEARNEDGSRVRSKLHNDQRYNSIFRYSTNQMSYMKAKSVLAFLDSQSMGLDPQDPRRTEVSFWLAAASNDRSKCTVEDDEIIRLNLEFDKSRAEEAEEHSVHDGLVFNLETFVKDVRSKRVEFCEDNIGVFFMNKLDRCKKKRLLDIKELIQDYHYSEAVDTQVLGRRVADLIRRRCWNIDFDKSLLSVGQISAIYEQHSPCPCILKTSKIEPYNEFYGLSTAPGNYRSASKEMQEWIDVISVCRLIEQQSEQVFEDAALSLYLF